MRIDCKLFRALRPVKSRPYCLALFLLLTNLIYLHAQDKHVVQIKTFDHQLKPLGNIEVSLNDKPFIAVNAKGSAFTELVDSDLPPKAVKIKNEELEAESWNYSRGVVEIIVRKKSFKVYLWSVRDQSNNVLPGLKVDFKGRKSHALVASSSGYFSIPLALDEKFTSVNQFTVPGYTPVKFQLGDRENVLYVEVVKPAVAEVQEPVQKVTKEYFKDFDMAMLDSIQSLTVFYAVFKNFQIKDLSDAQKKRIDSKFNQLVKQLEDSVRRTEVIVGKISDSSFVKDDLAYLLEQAREESQTLEAQRADFDAKIKIISDKLASGIGSLDQQTRNKLLSDLTLLETLLKENESRFFKNQNDYRAIINSLKERFFDFSDLENRLSESELQRLEEQRIFRQRLLIIVSIAALFAILIVILIRFSIKLRKQKIQLEEANAEIKRMNENLEILVYVRTKLLAEAHKELDTFLYRASHDLRSPVCSIIGLCNIASTLLPTGESKELIDRVVMTTENMDKLLKKLSLISEINQPSDYSEIRLIEVITSIEDRFKMFIRENNVQFNVNCSVDVSVNSYPNLVGAILTNVIENALYYSSIKPRSKAIVDITATVEDNRVVVTVQDNGIGMDEHIQPRIFDMFFKGNTRSKGNGLGLYIVNKSLQTLEGEIKVESVVNEFSRFIIYLPTNLAPVKNPQMIEELQEA
ncbi:MAG TPA: HAMP domain-containing sensor histidine kinase [Chryseosolibacter sp.]